MGKAGAVAYSESCLELLLQPLSLCPLNGLLLVVFALEGGLLLLATVALTLLRRLARQPRPLLQRLTPPPLLLGTKIVLVLI